tara:strand:+ start:43 stop:174 length:132 start_codon:yes stop_codon:yes gene_type:complete
MDIGDIEYFIEESKDMDEVLDIYNMAKRRLERNVYLELQAEEE